MFEKLEEKTISPTQGIFFDGQIYDAYEFIHTQKVSPQFQLDITKHNAQYPVIRVKEFKKSHDRFLILDNQVYLIGASLKDLGKKWFGFNRMEWTTDELLSKI